MRHSAFILVLLMACSSAPKNNDALKQKKVTIQKETFVSVVVVLPQDESITLSSVVDQAAASLTQFRKVEEIPDSVTYDGYHVAYLKSGDADFNMPVAEELGAAIHDLSEDEIKLLASTKANIVFTFFGTKNDVMNKQHTINKFIHHLIENKKALTLDLSTFELFGPVAWKINRVENIKSENPNITGQVTLHYYREEEFCRIVTMGMDKFCLPEISIKRFTCSGGSTFGNLVNAVIQTLYEKPFLNGDSTLVIQLDSIRNEELRSLLLSDLKEGATRQGTLQLLAATPEQGDNPSAQLRIVFADDELGLAQEKAAQLVSSLFGAADSITYLKHDEELLAASRKARLRLPDLQKQFKQVLGPGYSIMVKVPFKTDGGGNEWMWVEVTKWDTQKMEGILQNDPFEISDLKAGALVKFDEADIFDYILNKPDGSYEGNETGKLIEERN